MTDAVRTLRFTLAFPGYDDPDGFDSVLDKIVDDLVEALPDQPFAGTSQQGILDASGLFSPNGPHADIESILADHVPAHAREAIANEIIDLVTKHAWPSTWYSQGCVCEGIPTTCDSACCTECGEATLLMMRCDKPRCRCGSGGPK